MLTPTRTLGALALLLVLVVLATHLLRPRSTPLVFYASAQGTGSACTQAAPCLPGAWWPLAGPGATLVLLDGVYRGDLGMLDPPNTLAGTPTAPITIRALHEGQVLLDAEHQRVALYLGDANDWFVVEGLNAKDCRDCFVLGGSTAPYTRAASHNRGRRLIGWGGTAGDDDANIFKTGRGVDNVFEDVAGWGDLSRKIFDGAQSLAPDSASQWSGYRRAWGEFNGWPMGVSQPTNTYQAGYRTRQQRFENVLGTWNTTGATGNAEGIFSLFYDCAAADISVRGTAVLGGFFYAVAGQRLDPTQLVMSLCTSDARYTDVVAYLGPGFPGKYPFSFLNQDVPQAAPPANNVCTNCVSVYGDGNPSRIQNQTGWTMPGFREGRTLAEALDGQSVYTLLPGLCYRYEGGTLTSQGLWPWPMGARLKAASVAAGRPMVDVDAIVAQLLGPPPDACRWDRQPVPPQPPSGPLTLACTGTLSSAPGTVALRCEQETKR